MKEKNQGTKGHHYRGKFTEGLLDNELILKALQIMRGQTILDAGCGTGYMSKLFSNVVSRSGRVYALDTDKFFLKTLKNETQGSIIITLEGDITKSIPLKESSVDLFYISTVIHIFSKQQMQGFLREVKRLLRPEALLAIVEFEKKETKSGPPLEFRHSPEELKEIVPLVPLNTVKVGEQFYMQIFQNRENKMIE
jgi:ubiquinone/menaquinone biosynthesis C-methylase UbiE